MAKKHYRSNKLEKSEQNYELRSVFLLIPQTSDRLTFYSIFGTFQQRQVILRIVVHHCWMNLFSGLGDEFAPAEFASEEFARKNSPFINSPTDQFALDQFAG